MVNTKEEKNCKEISAFVHVKRHNRKKIFSLFSLSLSLLFVAFSLVLAETLRNFFLNQKKFIIKKSERESFKKRDVFLLLLLRLLVVVRTTRRRTKCTRNRSLLKRENADDEKNELSFLCSRLRF